MGYKNINFEKSCVFLVTGGAGFIGSNLCEAILRKGYRVRCLDNLSCGRLQNLESFINHPDFRFIRGDIRDFKDCMEACDGVDYVLHHAAMGSVIQSIELPLLCEEINIKGTANMMEAARQKHVKKFVYASSSSVYGDALELPNTEGKEGMPLSPYAVTKRSDEEYGKLYTGLYGLDTYGLRYFNVFGKRQDSESTYAAVIPRFIKSLLQEEPPVIYGDGSQSRDFVYIENIIEANLKACSASSKAAGQVYNIATGKREDLMSVYNELCLLLKKNIAPRFEPERAGDIRHSYADIGIARALLGYQPDWDFQRGIRKSIEWYKGNL